MAETTKQEFNLEQEDGTLKIQSSMFAQIENSNTSTSNWSVVPIDQNRLLLQNTSARATMRGFDAGMGWCPTAIFADLLYSLHRKSWSGVVSADTDQGAKAVYFSNGKICFATSSVIDDRLGEVIYRRGMISLDDMTNSTIKVTKSQKFGQVLLQSNIFSNSELWVALKSQVQEIVQSLFLSSHIYFELKEGTNISPTEVVFYKGTDQLIDDCNIVGCLYREFVNMFDEDSTIVLNKTRAKFNTGTFEGDFIEMIKAKPKIGDLLEYSKLTPTYTYLTLMAFANKGVCKLKPSSNSKESIINMDGLAVLKAKIDAYDIVLNLVKSAFSNHKVDFPILSLQQFTEQLESSEDIYTSLLISDDGSLDKQSLHNMLLQSSFNKSKVETFAIKLDARIQFLLQMTLDMLPYDVAKAIKNDYAGMR